MPIAERLSFVLHLRFGRKTALRYALSPSLLNWYQVEIVISVLCRCMDLENSGYYCARGLNLNQECVMYIYDYAGAKSSPPPPQSNNWTRGLGLDVKKVLLI